MADYKLDFMGGFLPEHKRPGGKNTAFECMECGKKFHGRIPKSLEVECPYCFSVDVELA